MSRGIPGIDVSDWQKEIDWEAVAASGIGFAGIRASFGVTDDKHGRANLVQAQATGRILTYSYHYFKAGPAEPQVATFLAAISDAPMDLCPFLDIEDKGLDPAKTADLALEWLRLVEEQTGRKPGVYMNVESATRLRLTKRVEFAEYLLWVANYGVEEPRIPQPWTSWVIWQHGEGAAGSIPGISTTIDLDVAMTLEGLGPSDDSEPELEGDRSTDSPVQGTATRDDVA